MTILVNIDNGGTFTDVCISDGDKVVHAKSATTPHDLTQCFLDVLKRGSQELYGENDAARLIREAECLRYSTTAGTNAVVEHKGTPVAVLVEAGEESSVYGAIERLGDSALWRAMVPQAPVGIAVAADGSIDAGELTGLINGLLAGGALRLVVALSSDVAEQNIKATLLDRYPRHLLGAIPFLISFELAQDPNNARRTVTAVVNSYLHANMEHFLYGAESICKEQHLKRPLLIFRNDGASARVAKTTAIKTWGSGPRGGVEGAVAYARHYALDTLVAMDVGGTTTDISVVNDNTVRQRAYGEIEDVPTSFPLPSIHSFGVGGSSVVRVVDKAITIGPDSLGAAPGPACYGRGGTEATLTDAMLFAGILDADSYLGGELILDRERAEHALTSNVGTALGLDANGAAVAIIKAFEQTIAEQVMVAVKSSGREPAATTLLAFGGGGPIIASGIATAAGIKRVVIPRLSSVFSAFGIGFSHLAHEYQAPFDPGAIAAQRDELETRARRDMYGEGVEPDECSYSASLWSARGEDAVERPLNGDAIALPDDESDARLTVRGVYQLPALTFVAEAIKSYTVAATSNSVEIVLGDGNKHTMAVFDDAALSPGAEIVGPALIRGSYLTCLIAPSERVRVSSNGDLFLEGV